MDDEENDLEGLFEEYENANEENAEHNNSNINQSQPAETGEKVAAPKRTIKNPRLKFNADRLCGERGIPVVVKHFEGVKFKGKGHEVEDLSKLLSTLEHWCHRLYPSMKFEDCLRQIEKLGKKRPVQTCLRKIRLDMPILNEDFIGDDREENEAQPEVEEVPAQDAFDRLISEIQGSSSNQIASTPLPKASAPEQKLGSFGSNLTEEQRQRMEYNKMLATERRKAKFLATQTSATSYDESEDLFSKLSTSTVQSASHQQENNSMSEDIFNESTSLIGKKDDQALALNVGSEELELNDLVNLVDDDDEPSIIGATNNSSNVPVNNQKKFIDLCDEDDSKHTDKNNTEIIDLEKEAERNLEKNKVVQVINLERSSYSKPVAVVDLEAEALDLEEDKEMDNEVTAYHSNAEVPTDLHKKDFDIPVLEKSPNARTLQEDVESMEVD